MSTIEDRLRLLVRDGALNLPLPGSGQTWKRWQALIELSRDDVVLGRLAEAHADALAILDELGAQSRPGVWGVWAAEPPKPVVEASKRGDGVVLNGRKLWCSGAQMCDHALVSARFGDERALFAVDLSAPGVRVVPDSWHAIGMAESDSRAVDFEDVPAVAVGEPGDYLSRPGFWHGAIGVAACWFGGACGIADRLRRAVHDGRADEHAAAHLGAVASDLHAARTALFEAARSIDADPTADGRLRALRVRAIVENAATVTIDRVGRALGAGPLCQDADHARRVSDLTVYLRQSHAERDLAVLGRDVAESSAPW
ncbi:MAG: acyl-CoA dehydrogenase family protein [Nocardiaceae bacterium]|nr:acyl-CoA dehydrogenase family protein [Nocardiaceae bacterium]